MQRKSSSCQNTCDTRVACRIIVAESKLFVAYFSAGVGAAQFDYADDYDEEVSYLLGPPLQRQIICRQLWMPIYPFRQLKSWRRRGGGENSPSCRFKLLLSTVWPEGGLFKLSVDKHAKSRRNRPCGLTMRMAMGSMLAGIEQDPP